MSAARPRRTYIDPAVTAEAFVRRSGSWIAGMRRAADGFSAQVAMLDSDGLYALLNPIALNYRSEVRGAIRVRNAIAAGSESGERRAAADLQRGGDRSWALGRRFTAALRRDYC